MAKKPFKLLCLPAVANIQEVIKRFSPPIRLTKGSFKNLIFTFQPKKIKILHNGFNLTNFSFVWLSSFWNDRDLAYAVKLYLDHSKIPATYVEKNTSKLTDHMIFGLNKIPAPDTFFINSHDIKNNLEQIKKICGYPLIIKDIKGSRGIFSEYIKNERKLKRKMKKLPRHKKYMLQKFIPNDYDWGVMVVNGKVVSGEKSYSCKNEFRNNACNGATETFIDIKEIPKAVKEMALKGTRALGLSWSRADIIIDKNTQKPYLLEVNRCPGITAGTTEIDGGYAFLASKLKPFR